MIIGENTCTRATIFNSNDPSRVSQLQPFLDERLETFEVTNLKSTISACSFSEQGIISN